MTEHIIRKYCFYIFSNYIKEEQMNILYNIDIFTYALKSLCKEYKDVDISLLSRSDYNKFTKKIDNVLDYIVEYGEKMPKYCLV